MLKYLAAPDLVPDGYTANLIRYPLAALAYLPWLIIGIRRGSLRGFWLPALLPSSVNVVGQTLWGIAPYHIAPGLQTFLFRLSTVWGILGAFCLFRDERKLARSSWFWIGSALALIGFAAMSLPGLKAGSDVGLTGIIIMFFCGVCYGAYGVTVRYVMRNLDPLVVFSVISLYTSLGLIALAPLGQPASVLHLTPLPLAILILSSVLGIAIAHGLYYIAVQRIGVAITSLALATTPFIALVGSQLLFGERFSTGQWAGGLILLAGSSAALRSQHHPPISPSAARMPEPSGP